MQEAVFRLHPLNPKKDLPQNPLRRLLFRIVKHSYFNALMFLLSLANVVIMALWHWNQSQRWRQALYWSNIGFVTSYLAELVMKVVALGPEGYW